VVRASEQVPRLLAMSTWLRSQQETTLAELAREFAITPEQARTDIGVLTMCEIPGQMGFYLLDVDLEEVDRTGVVRPGYDHAPDRPARFSADEAITLLVGLRLLAGTTSGATAEAVASATAKIAAAAGEHAPIADLISVSVPSAPEPVRAAVDAAIGGRRRLTLDYVDAYGHPSHRQVDPLATRLVDGYHYLEAWDLDRADWRSFRMDRIRAASVGPEPAGDHGRDSADGGPLWARSLAEADQITLWVRAAAAWITEYYPTTDVREATAADARRAGRPPHPGDLVVTLGVLDRAWLTGLLLRCGTDVVLLDPAGADEGALRSARAALARYRAVPAGPPDRVRSAQGDRARTTHVRH